MEAGNRNANKRRTNHWCNIFFVVCLVITQVFYWLYESCFAFTPVLCFVITAFSIGDGTGGGGAPGARAPPW